MLTPRIRYILCFLYLIFLFQSCTQQSTENFTAGGCSAVNVSSNATSSDSIGTSNLESSGPIEIPITIAKGSEGINPTSISFSRATSPSLNFLTTPNYQSTDSIGSITGQLTSQTSGTIALYIDNEYLLTLDTDSTGTFSFSVSESVKDQPIAIVEVDDSFTASADDVVSSPLILNFYDDDFTNQVEVEIYITNTDENVTDSDVAILIAEQNLATSHDSDIAFFGTNAANQNIVSIVGITETLNDNFIFDAPDGFSELAYDIDGNLYGSSSTTGDIYKVDTQGNITELEDFDNYPTKRQIQLNPSDRKYMAVSIYQNNPNLNQDSLSFGIIDIETGEKFEMPIDDSETLLVTDISFAWINNGIIVVIKEYSDGTYEYLNYYILGILGVFGELRADEADITFTSATKIFKPLRNYATNPGKAVFHCKDENNITQLCVYVSSRDQLIVATNETANIVNPVFSWDSTYLVFESENPNPNEANVLYFFNFITETYTEIGRGFLPQTSPSNIDFITYLIQDPQGSLQVGIKSIADLKSETTALTAGTNRSISITTNFFLVPSYGGLAPYSYASSNPDVAPIDEDLGLMTLQTTGTTTVTVTDSNGNTASVEITVTP